MQWRGWVVRPWESLMGMWLVLGRAAAVVCVLGACVGWCASSAWADGSGRLGEVYRADIPGGDVIVAAQGTAGRTDRAAPVDVATLSLGLPPGSRVEQAWLYLHNHGTQSDFSWGLEFGGQDVEMDFVGQSTHTCWGDENRNRVYRADVTAQVQASGEYEVRGFPSSRDSRFDSQGVALVVVTRDDAAPWVSRVLWSDGALALGTFADFSYRLEGIEAPEERAVSRLYIGMGDGQNPGNRLELDGEVLDDNAFQGAQGPLFDAARYEIGDRLAAGVERVDVSVTSAEDCLAWVYLGLVTYQGPLVDEDGDGVHDPDDNCPGVPNAGQEDRDGDGVGDACEVDSDGDGLDDNDEGRVGTDPQDADSDDDGVPDGDEGGGLGGGEPAGGGPAGDLDRDGAINARDTDSDGDGLLDGTEAGLTEADLGPDTDVGAGGFVPDADPGTTTNPYDPDTDDGGVWDGDEDADLNGALDAGERDPNDPSDDARADRDGDGLTDGQEDGIGTDPNDADSDDDGISDDDEGDPEGDPDGDGVINARDTDSDGDGLLDGTEAGLTEADLGPDTDVGAGGFVPDSDPGTTTNPYDPDTDDGGVRDGDEDADRDGEVDEGERDPNDPSDDVNDDRDGDGIPNRQDNCPDHANGQQEDLDDDNLGDACDGDLDGDGLPNSAEDSDGDGSFEEGETDPRDPDTDGDGLTDGEEQDVHRTDPRDPDTDNGGVEDGQEVDGGLDPLDASDDGSVGAGGMEAGKIRGSGLCSAAGGGSSGGGAWWGLGLVGLLWAARRGRRQAG
jgi:hypothetical protein